MPPHPNPLSHLVSLLKEQHVPNPLREAQLFLEAFGASWHNPQLEEETWRQLLQCVQLRKHQSFAHCVGETQWGNQTLLTPFNLLCPRPETEQLVQALSQTFSPPQVLWDLCCGTGNVSAFFRQKNPQLLIQAADQDPKALLITQKQAFPTQCFQCDLKKKEHWPHTTPDWVICNPPYLSYEEWKNTDQKESTLSLLGGAEGWETPLQILENLIEKVNPSTLIAFELSVTTSRQILKKSKKAFQKSPLENSERLRKIVEEKEEICLGTDWDERELFLIGKAKSF